MLLVAALLLVVNRDDQARFRPWHLLCHQLLHVVGEVMRYTSIDVLEPLWCDMHTRLLQSRNMDEVRRVAHDPVLNMAACPGVKPWTVSFMGGETLHGVMLRGETLDSLMLGGNTLGSLILGGNTLDNLML